MKQKYLDKFIIFLMGILIVFAVFLKFFALKGTQKLQEDEIEKSRQYIYQIATLIQKQTSQNIEYSLSNNNDLRHRLNETLQAFLTAQYSYIFLLGKTDNGHYQFLLDGSKENAEAYKTIFIPQSKQFDEVYKNQKMQIVEQKEEGIEGLWLSIVYPIVNNGKTESLLILDLSEEYASYLKTFNSPLMTVVFYMQWFLLLSLVTMFYLVYRYYVTRKKLIQDDLTQAYTKKYLREFFDTHQMEHYYVGLIDIDSYQEINKTYGVKFGDEVLKQFVKRINIALPNQSLAVRMGGTEFCIVVPKKNNHFEEFSNSFYSLLKDKPYIWNKNSVRLSISMSMMAIPEESKNLHTVQRLLDKKLLEIKSKGKNALSFVKSLSTDELKYEDMDYIREALEEERFTCLYQPICNTQTKSISKYEVLVRMVDKEDRSKLILPYLFLNNIQGTSQYIKMTRIILNQVFDILQKYEDIELSVNLDLNDLYNEEMMHLINTFLSSNKTTAHRLTFEILEEHAIYDYATVNKVFDQLKTYGSQIAIDDFGSGYSNYEYLIRLNIDILKIDGQLIQNFLLAPEKVLIVLVSLKKLAEDLDIMLIAEFVSNETIYKMLKEVGIPFSQGYYLGKPGTEEEYLV